MIATGKASAELGGFAIKGYGAHSPGGYSLTAAIVAKVVLTAIFLIVILGTTAKRAAAGFAGLAIGLCLTLIHLISIPVPNTSVNPARSTGVGVFGLRLPWASCGCSGCTDGGCGDGRHRLQMPANQPR